MGYLRAKDTVNGALGTCFAIIDGKRHELMQVKNIQAKVKKTRMTIPILGMTAKQQKSGGWEGTGTMTVYYVSSLFRRVMADYMEKTAWTPTFELLLTNEDPTGDAGRQTVLLKDVNIEEMLIGKIDVEEAAMEEGNEVYLWRRGASGQIQSDVRNFEEREGLFWDRNAFTERTGRTERRRKFF